MRHVLYAAHSIPSMTRTYQTAAAAMASSSQGAPPVAARASTPGGLSLTVATFNIGANADHMHQGLPTVWRGHVDNKNFMASNVDALPAGQVHVQKLVWLLEGASGIPRLVACGFALTVRSRESSGTGPARKADVRPNLRLASGGGGDLISGSDDASSAA